MGFWNKKNKDLRMDSVIIENQKLIANDKKDVNTNKHKNTKESGQTIKEYHNKSDDNSIREPNERLNNNDSMHLSVNESENLQESNENTKSHKHIENSNKNNNVNNYKSHSHIYNSKSVRKKDFLKERFLKKIEENTKLIIVLIPVFIITILLLGLVSQTIVISSVKNQMIKLESNIKEVRIDKTTRFTEVNDKYCAERIKKVLLENDLYVYSNSFWKYELFINGKSVKSDIVYVDKSEKFLKVELREIRKESSLPFSIINMGSVSRGDVGDSLESHIKIVNGEINSKVIRNELETTIIFEEKDISTKEKITFEISDQLASKLNILYTHIDIMLS